MAPCYCSSGAPKLISPSLPVCTVCVSCAHTCKEDMFVLDMCVGFVCLLTHVRV